MGTKMLKQIRDAISTLNPAEIRQMAEKPLVIEVVASSPESYREIGRFLAPPELSDQKRAQVRRIVFKTGEVPGVPAFKIYEEGLPHGPDDFSFYRSNPKQMVCEILDRQPDLAIVLARHLLNFRQPAVDRFIQNVSKENALFSLATAVPSVLPFLSLPWAVGEFASDTAFLTMNQMRLAFQIAAASDRVVGYREQKAELASLVAGAFGFRALARELVGKIPLGGGLIPKAAIAYAGTFVVGVSLDRFYRLGYGMSRSERKAAYAEAFERGKALASSMLATVRSQEQTSRSA